MLLGNRPTHCKFLKHFMEFITFRISGKTTHMKVKLTLILLCLLGIGIFARSQVRKKQSGKQVIENGPDAIPVIVTSHKKAHHVTSKPSIIRNYRPSPPGKPKAGRIKEPTGKPGIPPPPPPPTTPPLPAPPSLPPPPPVPPS